jgi:hypothetical protein
MNKLILSPGNGITFPKKGEYIKINLTIYDGKSNILFDTKKIGHMDILYGDDKYITEFEGLLGEMSLFEKCSFELSNTNENRIINTLVNNGNITAEIEILGISHYPHK